MSVMTDFSDLISNPPSQNIVTFDVFDTLIYRRYLKFDQVVSLVSAYALSVWGKAEREDLDSVSNMRWTTSGTMKGNPDVGEEPALIDIWTAISLPRTNDVVAAREAGCRIAAFEFAVERRNLAAIRGAKEMLQMLQKAGKRLIAISDMYFTHDEVMHFLRDAGLDCFFEKVFVSANEQLTKQTGNLFLHVWQELGVKPEQTCHIGDNAVSDIERPLELGANAIRILHDKKIGLERINYGRRYDIHLEIADLCKLFLFQIAFNAQRLGISKTYFLARDGILFREILQKWMPDILKNHFVMLDVDDLCLNRSGTSWLRVEFNGDWLTEVVGYAFFLNGGEATGKDIFAQIGVEDAPAALQLDVEYVSASDTKLVVDALRSAGLEASIMASIKRKKKQVLDYLKTVGFFDHKNVQLVDIGYSGTVICNLDKAFLLEDCMEPGTRPPRLYFQCLASNAYFMNNAGQAQPYGTFIKDILLPFERLPTDLSAGFAWLEYFFKHRSLGAFEGYRKNAKGMEPVYAKRPDSDFIVPSEHVLAAVEKRDDDIILLWMAATQNTSGLIAPLVERFAHPDMITISQMDAPVYETDARNTAERSIILTEPDLPAWEIYDLAKAGDYWIPGSLISSEMARKKKQSEHSFCPVYQKKQTIRQFLLNRLAPRSAAFDFDVDFYRLFYPDLGYFRTDAELAEHYQTYGRSVGRWGSQAEMLAGYKKRGWTVPAAFLKGRYHESEISNPSDKSWVASHRFVEHHGNQSRFGKAPSSTPIIHLPVPAAIDKSFTDLIACGKFLLTPDEQRQYDTGQTTATESVFRRFNILPGPWLNNFDVWEFRELNATWCDEVRTPAEAVLAFLRNGIALCAPLSRSNAFDATFYRKHYFENEDVSDEASYRDWLNRGIFLGYFPSRQAELEAHEEAHLRDKDKGQAWRDTTLSRNLATFLPEIGKRLAKEQFTAEQWAAQARYQMQHGDWPMAEAALLKAVGLEPNRAALWHELGDGYLAHGQDDKAREAFEHGIATRHPNRWSYIHAMRLNTLSNNYTRSFMYLCASAKPWKETKPWRLERQRLFQQWFDHEYPKVTNKPEDQRGFLTYLTGKMSAIGLPGILSLGHRNGPILVLCGREVQHRVLTRQWFDETGDKNQHVRVFSRGQVDLLIENLPGASMLIFNDVAIDAFVMDAALHAERYGIRRVFWGGCLAAGGVLSAEDSLGLGFDQLQYNDNLSITLRSMRSVALALLCDDVITTVPALLPTLHALGVNPFLVPSPFMRALGDVDLSAWKEGERIFVSFASQTAKGFTPQHILTHLEQFLEAHPAASLFVEGLPNDIQIKMSLMKRVERRQDLLTDDARTAILAACCLAIDVRQTGIEALWATGAMVATPVITLVDVKCPDMPPAGVVHTPDQLSSLLEDLFRNEKKKSMLLESNHDVVQKLSVPTKLETGPLREVTVGRRPRVLIINLFAPPQTIGGASRIVEDNLQYFMEHNSGIDFCVLAADDVNDVLAETRVDSWNGVPVFRVATPYEPDMYWRPHNAEIEAYTRRVVHLMQPDLVHIHCPQRLTIGVTDVCRALNVPYMITLHDSWWISDYPFLVREDGSSIRLDAVLPKQTYSHRIGLPRSLERAVRLRDALHHATLLIGVSKSYSEMYRRLGFDILTVENGISPPANLKRVPGNGHVRLGHFGGMEWHKGAHILEEALRKGKFKNLTLMIMDFSREAGTIVHEMWGTTPVTIRSKVLPSEIEQLYTETDVVVAASACPESYGLVAREGAAHGCWIIANADGAMGDDIEVGKNGFVVDTSTPDELIAVLRIIDNDPARYTQQPSVLPNLRTSMDQGYEMLDIYKKFLNGNVQKTKIDILIPKATGSDSSVK